MSGNGGLEARLKAMREARQQEQLQQENSVNNGNTGGYTAPPSGQELRFSGDLEELEEMLEEDTGLRSRRSNRESNENDTQNSGGKIKFTVNILYVLINPFFS